MASGDCRLGSSQGSGWTTRAHSQSCPQATCALCLLSGSLSCWKVNLHPSLSPLKHTFIWASEKHPSRVPVGMTLGSACLPLKKIQRIRVKAFSLGFNGPDSTASHSIPKPLPFTNNGGNSWVPSTQQNCFSRLPQIFAMRWSRQWALGVFTLTSAVRPYRDSSKWSQLDWPDVDPCQGEEHEFLKISLSLHKPRKCTGTNGKIPF